MSLALDARQRAMLAEMGVRLWAPRAPAEAPAPVESPPARAAPAPRVVGAPPAAAPAAAPAPVARPRPPAAAPAPQPAPASIALAPLPAGIDAMDWPALQAAVATCRACGLCAGRTQAVFGTGSQTADWMVVGEAPGEQEDLKGEPFVGPSGQLLDNMLKAIGLSRRAGVGQVGGAETAEGGAMAHAEPATPALRGVYIANVVKCRPPGNRNPHPDEVLKCDPYLARQVALVRPKIILAMGRFAVQSLLRSTEPIGKLRGRVHHYQGVPVIVTYHPAYLLRSLPEKAKAWADLCLAMDVAERGA